MALSDEIVDRLMGDGVPSVEEIEKRYPPSTAAMNQSGNPKKLALLDKKRKSVPQKKAVTATAAASVAAASREQERSASS